MLRVMFDTNAYDQILQYGDVERIEAAMFSIITTAAQKDELHQIVDPVRRTALLNAYHRLHAAMADVDAAWNVSRDSIIGKAAMAHCDLLVTDDRDLTNHLVMQAPALRVLRYEDFRKEFLS